MGGGRIACWEAMRHLVCTTFLCLSLLFLLSCAKKPEAPKANAKTYTVKGEVVRVETADHTVVLKHEKIEGWMEAMTMEFPVRNQEEFGKLKAGDRIEATLVVNDLEYYLSDVKVKAGGGQ